ncbi:MAG: alpha/beta hydrolase family protein [Pseudomonas sp.]
MKKLNALFLASAGMLLSLAAHAYDFSHQLTEDGVEYGFHQGDDNGPLLITITTDIKESMTDVYSPVGSLLAQRGYSVASIDVTCHGKDLLKHEKYGLDCWRARADSSQTNIFDDYIERLKSVIADIASKNRADTSKITILGVSRGGYLAMRSAAELQEVAIVIALAPVTDLFKLREFEGTKAPQSLYSLKPFYPEIATKHLFLQINNNDERVGTSQALSLVKEVAEAGGDNQVDITAIITPRKGHSTSEHEMAANWAISERTSASIEKQLEPPK